MAEKCYIYLFRHGQTYCNKNKIFTGRKDSKLTELGKMQAENLRKLLKNKRIDVGIQTPLLRSKMTLKIVLKGHNECKKIITDKRMIERSYGELSGKKHDFIIKKYGIEQFEKWHRGYKNRPPKGESFYDVEKRVRNFIKFLKKMIKQEKVNVAISAHGNSIRLFRKIMENAKISEMKSWVIPYDQYLE